MTDEDMERYGRESGRADALAGDAMSVDVAEDGEAYTAGYLAAYSEAVTELAAR
jgi:hypothetical protein